ncbi:MAG: protein-disulfide isomerase [Myxococcota bacterium]|jgi:protein-disulfide isomerase
MMLRLTAILSATLLVLACDKGEDKPAQEQVKPAAAEKGGAEAPSEKGAPAAKNAEAGSTAGTARGAAKGNNGDLKPASTNQVNAKVNIIEISDFQCPFCSRVNPTIAQIKKEYGDQVQLQFMHNALPFHKQAKGAAIAAVAADQQGKFWEMHDKLFENQKKLTATDLRGYAEGLGLDMARYDKDIKDPALATFVDKNQAIANAVGARGTPSFFINGKSLRGAQPFAQFKTVIDAEIAEADKASQKGSSFWEGRTKVNNAALHSYIYGGKTPPKTAPRPTPPPDRTVYKVDIDEKNDAIKGSNDAPVTIVVFSEFQCPFCKKIMPTSAEIEKAYGDKVRTVFKHNPLPFHKDAMPASTAALCAKDQGKFWEMHDKLFENQRNLGGADLEKYATELGLEMAAWKTCFGSDKYKAQILADQELAGKVTARGTPNSFVNGRKLTGAKPFAEFKTVIDEELKKAEALVAKGTKASDVYAKVIANGKVFEPLEAKVNTFKLEGSPMKGKADAKIQIVEFSDFQCPFCSRVTKPLLDVKAHYGDDAVIAFKHFPLSFHKEAMPAAVASMCALDQGKFWEYHDQLFANQKALKDDNLKTYAKNIGLDEAKFSTCLSSDAHKAKVTADMAEARAAGVRGTPTLFINGRKFNSPSGYNVQAFTSVIDKYLLKK